jgi:hypothetical protein
VAGVQQHGLVPSDQRFQCRSIPIGDITLEQNRIRCARHTPFLKQSLKILAQVAHFCTTHGLAILIRACGVISNIILRGAIAGAPHTFSQDDGEPTRQAKHLE